MKKRLSFLIPIVALLLSLVVQPLQAQESVEEFRNYYLGQFDYASRILQLAEAMPADIYNWRPADGVSSVEEVYTHIAYYNFYYPLNSLGIPVPDDVDLDAIESITGKEEVVDILDRSIEHVRQSVGSMDASQFMESFELYGQPTSGQNVLISLLTHMSEHIGQSITYARVNGVAPPWSQ